MAFYLDHAEPLTNHPVHEVQGGAGHGHRVLGQLVWRSLSVSRGTALKSQKRLSRWPQVEIITEFSLYKQCGLNICMLVSSCHSKQINSLKLLSAYYETQ